MGSVIGAGRRRARLAGGLAVPLALALAGVTGPAVAAGSGVLVPSPGGKCGKKAAEAGRAVGGADCVGPRGPAGPRGPKGDRGPAGAPGPCQDIDTVAVPGVNTGAEYSAALSRGRTYVGYRPTATAAYTWRDLTGRLTPGYPRNACSVSVKLDGDRVYVKVLTTSGDVFENWCATPALVCTQGWAAVIRPA